MQDRFYIRVRNQDGEVRFYDTDDHSGGYPCLAPVGYGKSFTDMDAAQKTIKNVFPEQKLTDRFPATLLHNAANLNFNNPKGWVKADIVRMVPTPVEGTEIHRDVVIRPEGPEDLRKSGLAKLSAAERAALGL